MKDRCGRKLNRIGTWKVIELGKGKKKRRQKKRQRWVGLMGSDNKWVRTAYLEPFSKYKMGGLSGTSTTVTEQEEDARASQDMSLVRAGVTVVMNTVGIFINIILLG